MLGYDVLQVANEGKMVAVVPAEEAQAALAAMRASKYGKDATIIGKVSPCLGADARRSSTNWPSMNRTDTASDQAPDADIPAIPTGSVRVRTPWGSTRILDMLVGEQLPRIC